MNTRHYPPVWLVALLVFMAFVFQGTRGIWEPDEGRYTSVGLNMLESGDYLLPTIDGERPHLTKPPITYWALAGSFALLGRNEWAARLPGALAFIGTGLLVFGLGRRFCPAKPWLPAYPREPRKARGTAGFQANWGSSRPVRIRRRPACTRGCHGPPPNWSCGLQTPVRAHWCRQSCCPAGSS